MIAFTLCFAKHCYAVLYYFIAADTVTFSSLMS